MKLKILPPLNEILNNRVYIAKYIKVFSVSDISKEWGVSNKTVQRYVSEDYRKLSRVAAKRTTDAYKAIDKSLCQLCNDKLVGHARCPTCTMLVHGEPDCSCNMGCIDQVAYLKLIVRIKS